MYFQKIAKQLKRIPLPFRTKLAYNPTFFLRHHFLQSFYQMISPDINVSFDRQKIFFMDGGHVSLDWANRKSANEGRPIILIMHGMTGGSETKYIKALVQKANENNYCSVCLNSRGINSQMTSPIPFTGFEFHELETTLSRIKLLYPNNHLYLIGTSLGGNYFLRYVLQHKIEKLMGMALICPPFDVKYVIDGMNMHYQKFFIKSYIKNTILKHKEMQFWWRNGIIDIEHLKQSKTLRDFHDRITIQLLGFDCSDQLFAHFKIPDQKIQNMAIKTFILTSEDDPMVGFPSFPLSAIGKNPNIEMIITKHGGHLCWFQGIVPKRWYPTPVFDFINKTEKEHQQKFLLNL